VSDVPDPDAIPGYIIPPEVPDTAPLTVGEARRLHKMMGTLTTTVGTFNERLAGGERRWAFLTAIGVVIVLVLGGVVWLGLGVNRIARCQAQQSDAILTSSSNSRAARDQQDLQLVNLLDQQGAQLDQQLDLFNIVLNPVSTQDERVTASLAYRNKVMASKAANLSARAAITAALKSRADNPLPTGRCT
jgi:hypothetical protein